MSIVWNGQFIVAPSTQVNVNTANLANLTTGAANVLAIVGPSEGGTPQTPILLNSPGQALQTLRSGDLLETISIAFDPSSQTGGATNIYAVRANSATASSAKVFDIASPTNATGTITVAGTVAAGQTLTVTISGVAFTYTTSGADTVTTIANSLVTSINSSISSLINSPLTGVTASNIAGIITLNALYSGIDGNSITVTVSAGTGSATIVASSATLTGGTGHTLFTLTSKDYGIYTSQIFYNFAAGSTVGIKSTFGIPTIGNITGGTLTQDNISRTLISIQYTGSGSACTLTVNDTSLTTSVTGTPADNLNISFATYTTVQQLVSYITATGKYTVSLAQSTSGTYNTASQFDPQTALDIKTSSKTLTANLQALIDYINSSSSPYANATRSVNPYSGMPAFGANYSYMVGGSDGTLASLDWSNAINSLQTVNCQIITSTSTDATIHAAVSAHVQFMSANPATRRVAICGGALGEYSSASPTPTAAITQRAINLNSSRVALVSPGIQYVNTSNVTTLGSSAFSAAFIAGMFAAVPAGTALTGQYLSNVQGLEVNFSPTDITALLLSGVLPIQYILNRGYKVVQSLTTWNGAENFANNEMSVVLAIDAVVIALQQTLNDQLIGKTVSPTILAQAVSITQTQLQQAQNSGYIVGDTNSPAYKSISANGSGDVINVQFEMSPAIPANYILISIATNPYTGSVSAASTS